MKRQITPVLNPTETPNKPQDNPTQTPKVKEKDNVKVKEGDDVATRPLPLSQKIRTTNFCFIKITNHTIFV